MKISVVIPARNAQSTLQETLASVWAQHDSNCEVIVVNDGSSDGTSALLEEQCRAHAHLRVEPGPCQGVSAARNRGVAQAKGDVVAFLDADDLWLPGKLAAHRAHLTAEPEVGVSFDRIRFVMLDGRPTPVTSTRHVRHLSASHWLYENPASTASTLVVRRCVFDEVGGFDESMRYAEDLEWLLRVATRSRWRLEGLDRVLTHYRASPDGASADLQAMQDGWEALMAKVAKDAPDLVNEHYDRARAVHLRYLARRALRLGLPARQGLDLMAQALRSSPAALLMAPRRTLGTGLALLAHAGLGLKGKA